MSSNTEQPTSLTENQKLHALAFKYYQGSKWEPKAGDYYTTSRADLELYKVVEVTDDKIMTTYLTPNSEISKWDKETFLTEGFGINRVWVPDWILSLSPSSSPKKEVVEGEGKGAELERLWPEYFTNHNFTDEQLLLGRCKQTLENIEIRYNEGCKSNITRGQVTDIQSLLSEIRKALSTTPDKAISAEGMLEENKRLKNALDFNVKQNVRLIRQLAMPSQLFNHVNESKDIIYFQPSPNTWVNIFTGEGVTDVMLKDDMIPYTTPDKAISVEAEKDGWKPLNTLSTDIDTSEIEILFDTGEIFPYEYKWPFAIAQSWRKISASPNPKNQNIEEAAKEYAVERLTNNSGESHLVIIIEPAIADIEIGSVLIVPYADGFKDPEKALVQVDKNGFPKKANDKFAVVSKFIYD